MGHHLVQTREQRAHGADRATGQHLEAVVGHASPARRRLLPQDREARVELGRPDASHETGGQARTDPLVDPLELPRQPVGRDDHALAA